MEVITPKDPEYNSVRMNWDTRFQFYPKKILQPTTHQGAQEALRYIQKKKSPYAIRSGKHCFEPWSLTNGLLLDLSRLNSIRLDKKIAVIGTGVLLGDIYQTLLDQGRFIPAGTRPTVGIGGQGLNGGIGYSTRTYGLLTDSIVQYQVLLANGKIVSASKDENSDLFWALRGCGASNFGIVLEYSVRTYRAPSVTVFTYNYGFSKEAIQWLTSIRNNKKLTCQGLISKDGVKITGQLFGRPEELLVELKDLPLPNSSEIKYVSFRSAVEYWSAPTVRESVKAKSRFFSKPLPESTIENLFKSIQNIALDPRARFTIGLQQLRGKASGSMPWKKSTYWINWALRWTEGPEPEAQELEQSYLNTLPDADPWCYQGMMDLHLDPPNYLKAYYGSQKNQEKLLSIQKKFDPNEFFCYPQGLKRSQHG